LKKYMLYRLILIPLILAGCLSAATLLVPQATDGGNWRFVLVVTNTGTTPATAEVTFFQDTSNGNTSPWSPPVDNNSPILTIPPGASVFIHSAGTASTLTQGFAQITTTNAAVQAYIVYTYAPGATSSDATSEAVVPTTHSLVPIDNTGNISSAIAIANANPNPITVDVNFNIGGATSSGTPITVPGMGHIAVLVATQFSQTNHLAGLMELSSTEPFGVLSLRADNNPTTHFFSFTSAPVYSDNNAPIDTPAGGGGGGGGGTIPAGDITSAGFSIEKITSTATNSPMIFHQERVGGDFAAFTPAAFNAPYSATKIDNCYVWENSYSTGAKYPGAPDVFLDSGNVFFKGAGVAGTDQLTETKTAAGPTYSSLLANGTLQGGATYDLSSTGGTQVMPWDITVTMPTAFTTNLQSINQIDRTKALNLTWDGTGFGSVVIALDTVVLSATSVHQVVVSCIVDATLKAFTVTSNVLSHLLPIPASFTQATGAISMATAPIFNASAPNLITQFTPGLVGGGKVKYGSVVAGVEESRTLPVI